MAEQASFEWAVNTSIMFTEWPLLERPAQAARAGFTEIESWWPFERPDPDAAEVDAFIEAVAASGVRLIAMNLWGGTLAAGERGVASLPERCGELVASAEVAAEIAGALGCRMFNTLYGNRDSRYDPGLQDEVATDTLAAAARTVAKVEGTLLLEPLSGFPAYPLRTAEDCVEVLDRVPEPNLALLCDVYHLSANGESPEAVLERWLPRVAHVQFADHPGRHEPGTGRLDFDRYLRLLTRLGWQGRIAWEFQPAVSTEESLAALTRFAGPRGPAPRGFDFRMPELSDAVWAEIARVGLDGTQNQRVSSDELASAEPGGGVLGFASAEPGYFASAESGSEVFDAFDNPGREVSEPGAEESDRS